MPASPAQGTSSPDQPMPEAAGQPPKVHQAPKRSAFGALLSRTLPQYSGPYGVGVCDVELPVAPRTFGNFRHKSMPGAPAAGLALETVLFTLFYPADAPKDPVPAVWFPK
jgi:platelet-activating factor acetylhydrolase